MYPTPTDSPIQRRLLLVRHAKACEDQGRGDHARPLSPQGIEQAQALGAWLETAQAWPDQVLCSTAARTRQTLETFGKSLPTLWIDSLYLASAGEMVHQLRRLPDTVQDVMIVGHNPGIPAVLALLTGSYAEESDADRLLLSFPTAGCAALSFTLDHWRDIAPQIFLRFSRVQDGGIVPDQLHCTPRRAAAHQHLRESRTRVNNLSGDDKAQKKYRPRHV